MNHSELLPFLQQLLSSSEFRTASFAGKPHGSRPVPWQRVQLRALLLRERPQIQFSYFDGRQTNTKNFDPSSLADPLAEVVAAQFSDIHVSCMAEELNIRTSKQGKVHISRRANSGPKELPSHNRTKKLPLPEGEANPVLEQMGILTAAGQVRPTMRAKYMQINEFLKHLLHVFDGSGLEKLDRPIQILDCGCGAAYLTIAVHHYLNAVLKKPAVVVGVDINPEVIRKSVARAGSPGTLNFVTGTIGELTTPADVVLALHACNRATDDAILQAIRSEAKLFLGVPCCHQDLNQQLQAQGEASVLRPILRHGIVHERQAELLTDSFRALWLQKHGYRTDIVEFTSPEHTARNVMIRAVRAKGLDRETASQEFAAMKAFWGVSVYLESATNQAEQAIS